MPKDVRRHIAIALSLMFIVAVLLMPPAVHVELLRLLSRLWLGLTIASMIQRNFVDDDTENTLVYAYEPQLWALASAAMWIAAK